MGGEGGDLGEGFLVPSATCLIMLSTSSYGRTKTFDFFHWLSKTECVAKMKIQGTTHFILLPARMAAILLARFTKKSRTNATIPDRSERVV